MISDYAKTWVSHELYNCTQLRTVLGSPITIQGLDDAEPTTVGVYVDVDVTTPKEVWADTVQIRVVCVGRDEQQCYDLLRVCEAKMLLQPGFGRTWLVDPATKGLRVRQVAKVDIQPARSLGKPSTIYIGVLSLKVVGAPVS